MLLTINNFVGTAVMSLQTGKRLGFISSPIINPHNLNIVAFYITGPLVDHNPAVLFVSDIREVGSLGVIVDSSDNITGTEGLVRLQEIIDYGFNILNLKVVDDHKKKLGKIDSFTFDAGIFNIEQVLVKPGIGHRLSVMSLTISRKQIIEVTNEKMIVKSPDEKTTEKIVKKVESPDAIPFENPFRKPQMPLPDTKSVD